MEESKRDHFSDETSESFILQFKPNTGFTIVFEFPCLKDLEEHQKTHHAPRPSHSSAQFSSDARKVCEDHMSAHD